VPDLDRALAWYCAALGLRPGYQFEVPPLKLRGGFALGDGDTGVELIELAGSVPGEPKLDPPSANAIQGFNHVCFHVADLDASYARLVEHGAGPVWDPRDSPEPGMRMAYVTDPDGNLIELVAPVASAALAATEAPAAVAATEAPAAPAATEAEASH
jgi:catechol 2,3-dioxygenase-like lactoylglutathione lyase family enzyme